MRKKLSKEKLKELKEKFEKLHKDKPKGGQYHWDKYLEEEPSGHKSDNNS